MKKLFPFTSAARSLFANGRPTRVASWSLAAVLLASCAVLDTHQAKLDQKQLREVLMDYVDDQILDNLIRASNGLPIGHFDLSNITGSVTSKFIPTVGGSRVVTDVRSRTPTHSTVTTNQTTTAPAGQTIVNTVARTVSAAGGVVETVAKPFNGGMGAERDNAISVQADPLLDEPNVYVAYVEFLNTDIVTDESENRPFSTPAETQDDTKARKTTTTEATTLAEPEPTESPAETPGAKKAADFAETLSTTGQKTAKPKPPPKKPTSTQPSAKVDLVVKNFSSIKSLRKSPTVPALADVLVGPKRWKDGMYYWVPKRYQRQFFALCMATVARGGAPSGAATGKESDAVKALKENSAILRRQELK
jgi:hypothetical protein